METVAVKRVFGHRAASIPMSSQKSMVGHLIGASGALEAAATALSLERGVIPPTINQATPDPDCDLDYVPNTAREMPLRDGHLQQLRLRRPERLAGHGPPLIRGGRGNRPSPQPDLPRRLAGAEGSWSPGPMRRWVRSSGV